MRTPTVPQEFDDRQHHRDSNAWNGPEHGHSDGAQDRQPEFPVLNAIDARKILELEEADGCRDDHCRKGRVRKILEGHGRGDDDHPHDDGPDDARKLGLGAGGFRDRSAR